MDRSVHEYALLTLSRGTSFTRVGPRPTRLAQGCPRSLMRYPQRSRARCRRASPQALLKFQSSLPGGVGHGANAAVIQKSASIEDDALDALVDRALGDRLADRFSAFQVPARDAFAERRLQRRVDARRRHERLSVEVVDDLRVDVRHAAEHAQARALLRSQDPLSLAQLNAVTAIVLRVDFHLFNSPGPQP